MSDFVVPPPLNIPGYSAETAPEVKLAVIANVWIKLMRFTKIGDYVPGRKHVFDHATVLAQGSVEVEIAGEKTTFIAPNIIYIQKSLEHKITALEANTVVLCIHALRGADATEDIISEDMIPKGANPLTLFKNYDLGAIIERFEQQ
jgi:hypothetical protein